MLKNEERGYHMELIANQDTPEAARRRMEQQLNELKSKRLNQKETNIQKILEKQFYDNADELRKNDSEAFAYECYLEQENQMLDKLKKRQKEKAEEEFYVQLNKFDNLKKIEKEKEDEKVQKEKKKKVYDYQQWQRQQNEIALQHANDLADIEKARLKVQWQQDEEMEQENQKKRRLLNAQVYRDIEDFNKKEEDLRKQKEDFEKQKDKELVQSILEKEKALDKLDKLEKEKRLEEFNQNKKYLEHVMAQKKEAEIWMDKIAQDEADRAYQKEQELWLKEEQKRIQLLKDVYKAREQAVMYNKQIKEDEKQQILKERQILDQEIQDYYQKVEEINRADAARRKRHQNELKVQINDKESYRRKELQDKLYEERAAKLWEMEYQKKIDEQRKLHIQRLTEIRNRNLGV